MLIGILSVQFFLGVQGPLGRVVMEIVVSLSTFAGSYHSSCHHPWTSFLPYMLPHRPRIKAPIILQNIVDPILIIATPAWSLMAPGIRTSQVISLQPF